MKTILSTLLLIGILNVNAQGNVFLSGKFWDQTTSVDDVKTAIKNGNDPSEFNAFNFDATTYAILNNSPLETIEFLLKIEGNEVSKITHDARNYLMWAGNKGNFELVESLIKKGSDIHILDDKGNNLQTFTAMGGTLDPRIYELYKQYGLQLSAPNRKGGTIIHYLAQNVEDIKDFDYFISEGLDITAKDNDNNTVLHYAASQGKMKLIEQLISAGFDPNARNNNNEHILFFAARGKRGFQCQSLYIQYLTELGLDATLTNKQGDNLLHAVAINNTDPSVFRFIIKQGADVQKVNNYGNTPLMNAAIRNNEIGIEVLYDLTKEKFLVNTEGYSLLTYGLRSQNKGLVERSLKDGADFTLVDQKEDNLITHLVATYKDNSLDYFTHYFNVLQTKNVAVQNHTLHIATSKESETLVNLLTEAGVDINATNSEGLTPLQLAAMKGDHPSFIKFLIGKGADKNVVTDFDESIYELAKSNELLEGNLEFLK
ncbi:MAG TPA: ankyrin repeat domain-containing protein [Brumimicrobium sp.]|nr:ankyrin repeat domain-containing protein [Brumimicrobium sp.]